MYSLIEKKYMQLCSEEALKSLGIDSLLYTPGMNITDYFTDDIGLLKKRSIIFDDTLNITGLYEVIESVTRHLSDISEVLRSEVAVGDKERSVFSIKQLQLYFEIIDELNDFYVSKILPVKTTFKSVEYSDLFTRINNIAINDEYISLKAGAKKLLDKVTYMKSVSIGFNLDTKLSPLEMGILSINTKPIYSGKLIDKILRMDFFDDNLQAIEPIIAVSKSLEKEDNQLIQDSLLRAVDKIFLKAVQNWPANIRKYIKTNLSFLLDLLYDFRFIVSVTRIHLKMKSLGLPMCTPVYHPKEEKVFKASDLYNPLLAISMKESSSPNVIVGNDITFDEHGMIYVLTGPNNGGKTVFISSVAIAQILAQLGMLVPATSFEVSPADRIYVHFPKYLAKMKMGRLEDECSRMQEIFRTLSEYCLCLFDETFSSTDSEEGCFLAYEILKAIGSLKARAVFGTHFHHLTSMINSAEKEGTGISGLDFLCAEILNGKTRTYRITRSRPEGKSYAQEIAMKYGLSYDKLVNMNRNTV